MILRTLKKGRLNAFRNKKSLKFSMGLGNTYTVRTLYKSGQGLQCTKELFTEAIKILQRIEWLLFCLLLILNIERTI